MPQINRDEWCKTAGDVVHVRGGQCEFTACPERCAYQPAVDPELGSMVALILCPIRWNPEKSGDCGQGEGCLACCGCSYSSSPSSSSNIAHASSSSRSSSSSAASSSSSPSRSSSPASVDSGMRASAS